jgi:hypothetical protein
MSQPRLLPDFAAVPTAAERRAAARWHVQTALPLDVDTPAPVACAVCASADHGTDSCPHGSAPTLLDDDVNSPERVEARRAMFTGFGWTR